ncbi:hypothetical protein BDV40DRAFT_256875 [Aspergillus tamarii]|uniref:Secreted protein n=1 Tax=Aspergillus tamarii TaxID=41984 RepID=A0A5N6V5T3_ASPTM|nr:hypothetical protein BDV40DRAFT_256875 [Aspergillus tamarii]
MHFLFFLFSVVFQTNNQKRETPWWQCISFRSEGDSPPVSRVPSSGSSIHHSYSIALLSAQSPSSATSPDLAFSSPGIQWV